MTPEQMAELSEGKEYAQRLLLSLVAQYFPDNPTIKPLQSLPGIISQIDNATTIIRDLKAEVERLKDLIAAAPKWWAVKYGNGPTVPGDCFQRKEDAERYARAFKAAVSPVAIVLLPQPPEVKHEPA